MTLKEIETLISFIAQLGLEEVNIETEQIKLAVKRRSSSAQTAFYPKAMPELAAERPDKVSTSASQSIETPGSSAVGEYITIKSPMIGTFYRSSNPNNPPFVQEGTTVTVAQPLCVIEAMKLFNEIEAETAGTIIKILVEDTSPVEYDQPLFLIKPT